MKQTAAVNRDSDNLLRGQELSDSLLGASIQKNHREWKKLMSVPNTDHQLRILAQNYVCEYQKTGTEPNQEKR